MNRFLVLFLLVAQLSWSQEFVGELKKFQGQELAFRHSASYGNFPNYQWTDQNGQSIDLYQELNKNKTIILSFFSVWNSSCVDKIFVLNHLHETYGALDKAKIISVESNTLQSLSNMGLNNGEEIPVNWGIKHSFVNLDGLDAFLSNNVTSTPSYIVISPDKSYTIISGIQSFTFTLTELNKAFLSSQNLPVLHDLDILQFVYYRCGDEYTFVGYIQNTGTNSINDFTIDINDAKGVSLYNHSSTTPINPNDLIEFTITLPISQFDSLPHLLELSTTAPYENILNNNRSLNKIDYIVNKKITIEIQTDKYPEETAWALFDQTDEKFLAIHGIDTSKNKITGIGQGNHLNQFTLDINHCYNFLILDKNKDGICCTNGNGYVKITETETGTVIRRFGIFDEAYRVNFQASDGYLSHEEIELNKAKTVLYTNYKNLLGQDISYPTKNSFYFEIKTYEDNSQSISKKWMK
ncbi:MAG: redoxin domain-containing protein [Flavobacteriales bacterium]|jgi:hypothetical protein|nr:redoxin domain-containing protein [Flavobacteriales bacterium]